MKVIITYILTGIPSINVKGAAVGTAAAYLTASVFNLIAVRRYTGCRPDISLTYVKPAFSAAVMGVVVWVIHHLTSGLVGNAVSTMISVLCGVLVYAVLILVLKGITPEEIRMLPKGEKIS